MRRTWFIASWLAIALGATALAGVACGGGASSAAAATQRFGPKEASVTSEDGGWKAVHLTASKFQWQFRDDQPAVEVWGYNEQIPGPTMRFRPGDKVRVYLRNDLDEYTSIQWHGLDVPNSMNGVPMISTHEVMPGETLVYEFTVPNTPGTFYYRAQMDDAVQAGSGLSGAFVIDPRDNSNAHYDQDRIVFLSNIAGHYLINGREFPNVDRWLIRSGDHLRVRMIDASTTDGHSMYFQGHHVTEIARDGSELDSKASAPTQNTVWIAPGQTLDLALKADAAGKGAWLFSCQTLSHSSGPQGKALNLALWLGGETIAVEYTDSLNFEAIDSAINGAFKAVVIDTPTPKPTPTEGTPQATETSQAAETPQATGTPAAGETPQANGTAAAGETPQANGTAAAGETPQAQSTEAAATPAATGTPQAAATP
jgi:FtsP/CotA-like multicopper oxidase with cupredoxin domain